MVGFFIKDLIELIDNIRFIRVFRYMSLMMYCTSLFVCESVRKSQRIKNMTWIESLFMCFMGQFGGTTIASILLGQPVRFLTSDKLVIALLAAWLTIFWAPFDIGLKIFELPIVRLFCRFFQLLNISFSVTAYGVDYVFKSDHPKAMVGLSMLIVVGTISGCGGGVLLHYYNLVRDDYTTPSKNNFDNEDMDVSVQNFPQDLIRPTFAVERSFFACLFYIFLLDPLNFIRGYPLFDKPTCHILIFIFVLITTALESYGWNVFSSVSSIFHHITFVPKEIPAFARRWSFEEIQEKSKEL